MLKWKEKSANLGQATPPGCMLFDQARVWNTLVWTYRDCKVNKMCNAFLLSADFFKINFFKKFFQESNRLTFCPT